MERTAWMEPRVQQDPLVQQAQQERTGPMGWTVLRGRKVRLAQQAQQEPTVLMDWMGPQALKVQQVRRDPQVHRVQRARTVQTV